MNGFGIELSTIVSAPKMELNRSIQANLFEFFSFIMFRIYYLPLFIDHDDFYYNVFTPKKRSISDKFYKRMILLKHLSMIEMNFWK